MPRISSDLPGALKKGGQYLRTVAAHRELWLVLGLTAFAAALRLWRLTTLPYGFHGDEANVALDADQILQHGWIGPWSGRALGYPIAFNYWVAPFIKVLGFGVLSSRLPAALAGIAAIPLAYAVCRNVAGTRAATCGALLLSVSLWHLHLSRVSLPAIAWPTVQLAALLCLQMGMKTRRWPYFVGSGLCVGVTLWIYPSFSIVAIAIAIYLSGWTAVQIWRRRNRALVRDVALLAILGASAFFAAKPILDYARQPNSTYSDRFSTVYIFSDQLYKRCLDQPIAIRDEVCSNALTRSWTGRIEIVRHRLRRLYEHMTTASVQDGADGLGGHPPLGKMVAYLAIAGAAVALVRYRTNESVIIGLMAIPMLAVADATMLSGEYRRAFGALPFLTMFAGIALGSVWEWADRQRWWLNAMGVALICGAIGVAAYDSLNFYFGDFQEDPNTHFVFNPETRGALQVVDSLDRPYVYYYDSRVSLNYETRFVLAPEIAGGEDRSREFTTEDKTLPPRYDLKPSQRIIQPVTREPQGVVFVFVGGYVADVEKVMGRYPGGVLSEKFNKTYNHFDYRAWYLPKDLADKYMRQEGVTLPPIQAESPH